MNKLKVTKKRLRSRRQMYEGEDGDPTIYFRAKKYSWTIAKIPYGFLKYALKGSGLFELGYKKLNNEFFFKYVFTLFPNDPIVLRRKNDVVTFEGRLSQQSEERFK